MVIYAVKKRNKSVDLNRNCFFLSLLKKQGQTISKVLKVNFIIFKKKILSYTIYILDKNIWLKGSNKIEGGGP